MRKAGTSRIYISENEPLYGKTGIDYIEVTGSVPAKIRRKLGKEMLLFFLRNVKVKRVKLNE